MSRGSRRGCPPCAVDTGADGQSPWLAGGELSGADFQMSYPLEAAASRGGLGASRPQLSSYLERIHARPAYQRALEKGGRFEIPR